MWVLIREKKDADTDGYVNSHQHEVKSTLDIFVENNILHVKNSLGMMHCYPIDNLQKWEYKLDD